LAQLENGTRWRIQWSKPQLFFGGNPLTNAKLDNIISSFNRKETTKFIPLASSNRQSLVLLAPQNKKVRYCHRYLIMDGKELADGNISGCRGGFYCLEQT
jgi:hypothetical protein